MLAVQKEDTVRPSYATTTGKSNSTMLALAWNLGSVLRPNVTALGGPSDLHGCGFPNTSPWRCAARERQRRPHPTRGMESWIGEKQVRPDPIEEDKLTKHSEFETSICNAQSNGMRITRLLAYRDLRFGRPEPKVAW